MFTLAWTGLGERVLGLATSSSSPPPSTTSTPTPDGTSTNTPSSARPLSSHDSTHKATCRPLSSPHHLLLPNLVKSLLVFTLTGLIHEAGNLSVGPVLEKLHSHSRSVPLIGTTTLFFAVQPIGIALEAVVKRFWRQWKTTHPGLSLGLGLEVERAVGFCWTWWWLGTTAGWVVEDWSKRGFYSVKLAEWSVLRYLLKGTFWV